MDTSARGDGAHLGERGILAPVARLDRWLRVVLVVLVATCALRYVLRHGLDPAAALVLLGATGLVGVYLSRGLLAGRAWWPPVWVGVVTLLWAALTVVAPSFAWTAVPLAFAALQVLPFPYAAGLVVLMTVVVSVAWTRITQWFDPTLVAGPFGIALVTVMAYRALERESRVRQKLLDELTEAQADLAAAQRRAGALAERTRLSREIHDSVSQGLSSINLLLGAADQDFERSPQSARTHLRTAAATAREGLDEVRRVVRDLAPAELEADPSGRALHVALRRVVEQVPRTVRSELRVHGDPTAVPAAVAAAVLRTARGALANVTDHSRATRVVVSLTHHPDELLLDVRDDGVGFDAQRRHRSRGLRGHGLAGIEHRAVSMGGWVSIESAPGEGTTVSLRLPVGQVPPVPDPRDQR